MGDGGIAELSQKMHFLHNDPLPRRVAGMGDSKGLDPLCKLLELSEKRTAIRDQISRGVLDQGYQWAFANKFGFDLRWPEWRAGSTEAFKLKYKDKHELKADPVPPEITFVVLKEDMWAENAKVETPLASLSLRTGQSANVPGEIMLGFDLNCPEMVASGLTSGVKRATIFFDCGEARTSELKERTGYLTGEVFNGVRFTPVSVDINHPSWLAEAVAKTAIGMVGDIPASFIKIFNLRPGRSVSAAVSAYIKDVSTTFAIPDGQETDIAIQKIKKRLREMSISSDKTGEGVIAKAGIKFMARES